MLVPVSYPNLGYILAISSMKRMIISTKFKGQMRLLNDTDPHIAPHRAAFANSLFMKKNNTIIEIQSRYCILYNETKRVDFDPHYMRAKMKHGRFGTLDTRVFTLFRPLVSASEQKGG